MQKKMNEQEKVGINIILQQKNCLFKHLRGVLRQGTAIPISHDLPALNREVTTSLGGKLGM